METSSLNHSGLDSRFAYLISSVEPLVRLGYFERARLHIAEAHRLLKELRQAGVRVNENNLLRADAIRLYASGHAKEALAEAQKHLALVPDTTSSVLSDNFERVELLERIRIYAAGIDATAYASATAQLARIWDNLKTTVSRSDPAG